ncbi:MAG: peptidase S55 [Romboutsia sp.]|nr:peptidase S55 [Romboutsia sp.]
MLNKKIYFKFLCIFVFILILSGLLKNKITINNVSVQTLNIVKTNKKYVYPLGNIVAIKAVADGVLVIGYEEEDVTYIGGVKIGDNIIKINDKDVNNSIDVYKILNSLKSEEVIITFERNGELKKENINVKYEDGVYKLGLWVRDKVSGVGTMTFYDPQNETFYAIGHAITDVDTNNLLKIKEGYLYNINNLEIIKGNSSSVGRINGKFDLSTEIGNFNNNSNFGISGDLVNNFKINNELMELGTSNDVKIGDAEIIFEDENRNIRRYKIKIEKIVNNKNLDRDMIIKVTDDELIDYTGGIIQGMSGIPIVQNNKLIGSITHVFKNNPKKGYGIFINEMIQ